MHFLYKDKNIVEKNTRIMYNRITFRGEQR